MHLAAFDAVALFVNEACSRSPSTSCRSSSRCALYIRLDLRGVVHRTTRHHTLKSNALYSRYLSCCFVPLSAAVLFILAYCLSRRHAVCRPSQWWSQAHHHVVFAFLTQCCCVRGCGIVDEMLTACLANEQHCAVPLPHLVTSERALPVGAALCSPLFINAIAALTYRLCSRVAPEPFLFISTCHLLRTLAAMPIRGGRTSFMSLFAGCS